MQIKTSKGFGSWGMLIPAAMFAASCKEEPVESKEPVESDPLPVDTQDSEPPAPPDGSVAGSLSLSDGESAAVVGWHAFTYANENAGLVYLSAAEGATCETLVASLFQQGDPSALFVPGQCNLQILSPEGIPLDHDFQSTTAATFQLFCPLGSGAFANVNNAWRWSGRWYVANATAGEVHLATALTVINGSVDLQTFSGSYPYEAGTPAATATGPVTGEVFGEECEALGSHPVFQ